MKLTLVPISLREANRFVGVEHRHRGPVRGHRWALGATVDGVLVGVVIVGRVTARQLHVPLRAEVTRLATNGTKNACSFLYQRARRVAQAMGYVSLKTYTLVTESGSSLRALGLQPELFVKAEEWDRPSRHRGSLGAAQSVDKWRWELIA